MAPNSLFAVLLRKPWWISLLVAAVVAVIPFALMPKDLAPYAAAGCAPFLIISALALKRQWRLPSAAQVEATTKAVSAMGWEAFRGVLEQAFAREGYEVERLHGAADLCLRKGGRSVLVAARRWKAARQGEDALQALQAVREAQDAGGAMFIALGEVSPQARAFADARGIALVQGEALAQLLRGVALR
ncbi:restriction endonuclease [Ramlibacter sp. MAHUQ-53]|uniref:restriction endonuclease n=1 Tax=unclassified Ramlibacter TaxID=2617605 RepID=UPI003637A764